jgi:hypothetical protein
MRNHFIEFDARQQRAHVKASISLRGGQKFLTYYLPLFYFLRHRLADREADAYFLRRLAHTHTSQTSVSCGRLVAAGQVILLGFGYFGQSQCFPPSLPLLGIASFR